jgi:hypothetical protein
VVARYFLCSRKLVHYFQVSVSRKTVLISFSFSERVFSVVILRSQLEGGYYKHPRRLTVVSESTNKQTKNVSEASLEIRRWPLVEHSLSQGQNIKKQIKSQARLPESRLALDAMALPPDLAFARKGGLSEANPFSRERKVETLIKCTSPRLNTSFRSFTPPHECFYFPSL